RRGPVRCHRNAAIERRASLREGSDDCDALATTRATSGQHFAATGRLHALAKSVDSRATTRLRLICALHDESLLPGTVVKLGHGRGLASGVCSVSSEAISATQAWLPG